MCLIKIPFLASKRAFNPRCYVKLSADKNIMDQHKSSAVFDPVNNVPLPPMDGLSPALPICKSFIHLSVNLKKYLTLDKMVLLLEST